MATYQDWKEGDLAIRKNRLCRILKIHFDEYPPHVTVKMLDDGNEIGTEFYKLRHPRPDEMRSMEENPGSSTTSGEPRTDNDVVINNHNNTTNSSSKITIENESENENENNKNENENNGNENENDNHNNIENNGNDNNDENDGENDQDIIANRNYNNKKNIPKFSRPTQAQHPLKQRKRKQHHQPKTPPTPKPKTNTNTSNRRWRGLDDEWRSSMFGRNFFEDFGFI